MEDLNEKAKYLQVDEEKANRIQEIREHFSSMYDFIEKICQSSREKSLVMTKLEEAQFWAIKGITREKIINEAGEEAGKIATQPLLKEC